MSTAPVLDNNALAMEDVGGYYQPTATDIVVDITIRAILGIARRTLSAPVDRLMILSTCEGEVVRQGRLPAGGFGGLLGCIRRTWKKEGAMGFLRGALADVCMDLPCGLATNIAMNAAFAMVSAAAPASMELGSTSSHLLFSLVASPLGYLLASPAVVIRKSIMTNYCADIVAPVGGTKSSEAPGAAVEECYLYASATETVRAIYRKHGWRGFYREGFFSDALSMFVYRFTCVAALYATGPAVIAANPHAYTRSLELLADFVTRPFEVVSRRMALTASSDADNKDEAANYKGLLDCAQRVVEEEGITALWAGMKLRVILGSISIALHLVFSE